MLTQFLNRHPAWPLLAAGASALMLAGAHAFEHFGGYPPCALCLHQREAHWVVLAIGLAGFALISRWPGRQPATAVNVLLCAAFLGSAAIAGFHVGVELKWWPGLPECAAAAPSATSDDLMGALGQPMRVVRCDEVAWSFLGLSMAAWNMLISLVLAAGSARAALNGGWLLRRPATRYGVE